MFRVDFDIKRCIHYFYHYLHAVFLISFHQVMILAYARVFYIFIVFNTMPVWKCNKITLIYSRLYVKVVNCMIKCDNYYSKIAVDIMQELYCQ